MNPLRLSIIIATGALLAFGVGAQAQGDDVPKKITLKLIARGSIEVDTGNSSILKTKLITMKVGTKDVLNALGTVLEQDFTGAALVLVGESVEVRRGADVLADVTSYFTAEESDAVAAETNNIDTGKDNYNGYKAQQLSFDDGNGHSFILVGLLHIVRSASASNENGEQAFSETQTMTGAGTGSFADNFVVVTGTITLKGKGKTTGFLE